MKHIEGTLLGYEGCHLYYQSWQPEGISHAIVVLIHGLGTHSGVFQNVVDYLVPQGYEVYALDLRGHGRSEGQRGYINRWQEFREDLHLLLQQIRSQRACCSYILWGHSLGGTIALDYILHYPENIQGAIVTAPALNKVNISNFKLSLGKLFSNVLPRFSLKLGFPHEENARTPAEQLAYEQDPLRHEYGTARLATEFSATVDWIYSHASEIKIPLLVMHGNADRVTLPEASRAFFQRVIFPDKEHREYPDSYHDLYVDAHARKVFTDLEIWLDRHLAHDLAGAQTCQFFLGNTLQNAALVPLGRTLPSLLEEACQRHPNAKALNQWTDLGWRSLSNQAFKSATETLAIGFLGLGLAKGDRVALLLHNDLNFAIADMGCLLAGLVDVPIDLTQTLENIFWALSHSEAKALVIANLDLLKQIAPYLGKAPNLQQIVIAEVPEDWQPTRSLVSELAEDIQNQNDSLEFTQNIPAQACLDLHTLLHGTRPESDLESRDIALPQCLQVFSLSELQTQGQSRATAHNLQILRSRLNSRDLATIIYIPAENGKLAGVMLTHENLSGNALAAFASLKDMEWGDREVGLSFLPLTHVFARCLFYGHLYYGHSIYLSHPNRVLKHLKEVQPTILASIPLLLEKFYSKIVERSKKSSSWWEQQIAGCGLRLAQQYELGHQPRGLSALPTKLAMQIADGLVYTQWRSLFGDRLKYLLSGGAALSPEIANAFNAAGIPVLQGYGLTQTGGVVCFNRLDNNHAGTVGSPIPGVEIAIATDGEILVRGLYVTPGYYKNAAATEAAIDPQGWLHTGDLGAFTDNGLLKITGMKKSLFKLSTGKYIAPQPLEAQLNKSILINQAAIVGSDRKFCSALIFVNLDALRDRVRALGFPDFSVTLSNDELFRHPCILALYRAEIDAINCHLPYWATVKRFLLIDAELTLENSLLSSAQHINRTAVIEHFSREIDILYGEQDERKLKNRNKVNNLEPENAQLDCADYDAIACPIFTQSLNPRFTN